MRSWDPRFEESLLTATDYRSFIRLFFERREGSPSPLTYGKFAARSGFASKSFMHGVLSGQKRITPRSLDRIALGLGLSTVWKDYLKALAALEEASFQTRKLQPQAASDQLEKLRGRIRRKASRKAIPPSARESVDALLSSDAADVYASLGELEAGESIEGIAKRSSLPKTRVEFVLHRLVEIGAAFQGEDGRFRPGANAFAIYGLGGENSFRNDFARAQEKALQRFDTQASSPGSLFMVQTVSVDSARLPIFRQKLADLIEEFTRDIEDPTGDRLAEVCVSLSQSASRS